MNLRANFHPEGDKKNNKTTKIKNANIPHSHLRKQIHLENTELPRSIIMFNSIDLL